LNNSGRLKTYIEKNSWLISLILSMGVMYLLLLFTKMAGNGEYLLLRGDGFKQFMGDIRMVTRSIINHENPLYQFCVSMGFSAVLPIALEVINPFNLLYLVFHRADFNLITIVLVLLKASAIGVSFHVFVRKVFKTTPFWAIVFSLFYTMSAFPVVYGTVYVFWLDVLYVIPLCALAVHKALYEKKVFLITIVFSYIFITQFYMGYLTGIFALAYYLLLLFTDRKNFIKKEVIRAIGRLVFSGVCAVMISAVVWVPVLMFLLKYNPSDRTAFSNPGINILEVLNNLFWGEVQTTDRAPYIYCGIPCLLLLPMFFLNKKIVLFEKLTYGILILFYVLGCFVTPLYRLLHAFDAPDSYNYRFSFMLSFLVCVVACRQIEYLKDIQKKYLIIWVIFLAVFYLLEGKLEKFEIGSYSANTGLHFYINLLFILAWIFILYVYSRKTRLGITLALILTVIETISNGYICLNAYGVMTRSGVLKAEYTKWENEYRAVLDYVEGSNDTKKSFYRMVAFDDYLHNSDSCFGYNGISDFCTGENENLRHLMEDMGLYTSKALTFATGMTPSLEMLLSVKYEVYLNINSDDVNKKGNLEINENEYYLPVGYMVNRETLNEIPMGLNAFENQNTLIQTLSGVGEIYEPVPEDHIEIVEDGLSLSGDKRSITKEYSDGTLVVMVRDESSPVYIQVEQEKQFVQGIFFTPFENMACYTDSFASFPYTAKMSDYGNSGKYVSMWSDDAFNGSLSITGVNIYRLNEDKLQEAYTVLNQNVLNVEEWENGYLKGNIDVTDSEKVFLINIPIVDGWKAYVDGKEVELLSGINGTFMTIDLPRKGHYEIELKYECPGLKIGILVSLVGLILLGLSIFLEKVRSKKTVYSE